jgi:protein phosphatase
VPRMLKIPPDQSVAIIADTHANLTALEAVLVDIDARGIKHIVHLGDVGGKGPRPREVFELLLERQIPIIYGNWDDLLSRRVQPDFMGDQPLMAQALDYQRDQIGIELQKALTRLPYALELQRFSGVVRLFHASARGLWVRVRENDPLESFYGLFDATDLVGTDAELPTAIGYGDIHTTLVKYLRRFPEPTPHMRGKMIFNVGSVGNPLDIPVPSYGILHGSIGLELTLVRVPYDIELECAAAIKSKMPQLEEYLQETRTGMYFPRGTPLPI